MSMTIARLKLRHQFMLALLLVMLCAVPALLFAAEPLDYRLKARALAPGVWVVEGAQADFAPANGCNIINTGFVATGAGVIVVNTGPSYRYGQQLRALIEQTTTEPIVRVVNLNQHPDYFLGNQAFADVPRAATPATRAAIARDGPAFEDNLYRLCGDWMAGTHTLPPDTDAAVGSETVGQRRLEWMELAGHTDSDLVLSVDDQVLFTGGLVFSQRIPTTPHARLDAWRASLDRLAALPPMQLVPSHGSVNKPDAIAQTARYLDWLDTRLRAAAAQGLDIPEILRLPVPEEFSRQAAFATEYPRNIVHLYPRYEQAALRH
ncbi:quinoprotein relay system zinc metallohydrolase 1 [Paucibacter sp. R3-3]|uniref:Quinoprotein relay system zinc metallohydrolase 1 n=1 Tax=Roseateles agri TaxID=3098619 RepID=A0ABU5DCT9_9BURK|nr:quinoprotein relay system zinc metallohydrolase 1 [Paucibacter sp. R3-3]MDY0743099.1 quinoprotein relay system zinc metallohydrolase 1 [Paucibacter sp. R3-3]